MYLFTKTANKLKNVYVDNLEELKKIFADLGIDLTLDQLHKAYVPRFKFEDCRIRVRSFLRFDDFTFPFLATDFLRRIHFLKKHPKGYCQACGSVKASCAYNCIDCGGFICNDCAYNLELLECSRCGWKVCQNCENKYGQGDSFYCKKCNSNSLIK